MTRWAVVVVVVSAVGCHPLAPGETRCTSTPAFGTTITNCKTGQAAPVPVTRAPIAADRWWCSTLTSRRLGACYRQREACEVYADGMNRGGDAMTECESQTFADCFDLLGVDGLVSAACAPTPGACREQRDFAVRNQPDGKHVIGECRTFE